MDDIKWTVRQYNTVNNNVAITDTSFDTEAEAHAFASGSAAVKTIVMHGEKLAKMDDYIAGIKAKFVK